ncbi:MAG: NAD(P)/FAD-dependent oxidoreductase [Methanospirillum sp.]
MKRRYDVLVIGGGPGGAVAARTAAEAGLSACLLEKRPAIGSPVRCAEGIGREALAEFIAPDPSWISAEIARAEIVAPDGSEMTLDASTAKDKVGYVLERKLFDRVLVGQAAAAGAEIAVKTMAVAPVMDGGRVCGTTVDRAGSAVRADIVIAADGVESRFARMCGIDTMVPRSEMMSAAQYLMTGIEIEPGTSVFALGNSVAPKGYLWVFPKGDRTANVGVGISGAASGPGHRAKDYLDAFVRRRFSDGRAIEFSTGGVPVCRPLASTVTDGLMIVGDAARVVNPITGGGIHHAMYTGRLAGEVAVKSSACGDSSATVLDDYDRRWRSSSFGTALERNYRLKEYFVTLSDDVLNRLVRSAASIRLEEFGMLQLVKALLLKNPAVLGDRAVLKLFSG